MPVVNKTPHDGDGPAPARPSRRKVLTFSLIAVGSFAAAGYFLWPAIRQFGQTAGSEERLVAVSMSGFAPNTISVRAGQLVSLQLVNKDNALHSDGGGWHQFAIDELGLDFKVPPLTVSKVSFTVDQAGVYDFYCGICCGGKANPYMHGELVVEV
jgi:cytochrome c oxidase subunit II